MSEKMSDMLQKLGHQESDDLFAVYNEIEYSQLISAAHSLQSELAQAKAEVETLRTWKRSVDEALNSGDGTYRP